MSIEASVVAALATVAGGRIYPLAAPEKAIKPFIVYKPKTEPVMTLGGAVVAHITTILFECWGETYASALSTASSIYPALQAANLYGAPADPPEDGYDPNVDEYVRPVALTFTSTT